MQILSINPDFRLFSLFFYFYSSALHLLLFRFLIAVFVGFGVSVEGHTENQEDYNLERDGFSFGNRGMDREMNNPEGEKVGAAGKPKPMPPTSVMTRLILIMVWRKLIRNPNTYSSLIGLTWSLVSFRYGTPLNPLRSVYLDSTVVNVSGYFFCFYF